jgi:hypothetical protein
MIIFSEVEFRPFLCDPNDPDNQSPYGKVSGPTEKFIELANVDFEGKSNPLERCPWWEAPHNVYFLYGYKSSDTLVKKNHAKWITLLSPEEYARVSDSNHLLLGYIVVEISNNEPLKVHYAKTFIRRKGILRLMIFKMQDYFQTLSWYPHEIPTNSSEIYSVWYSIWAKYYDDNSAKKMTTDAKKSFDICKLAKLKN